MKKITLRFTTLAIIVMLCLGSAGAKETVQASSSNEMQVFHYLIGTIGMSPAAACGVMANMYRESRYLPGAVNSSSGAIGLCQWTAGRTANLHSFCSRNGYGVRTLSGQLGFVNYELHNGYTKVHSKLLSLGNSRADAYTAGRYFCIYYEGSGTYASGAGSMAQRFYDRIATSFSPGKLTVESAGDGMGLSWTVYGSGRADILRSTKENTGFKVIATVDVSAGEYIDTTAKLGKTYYYGFSPKSAKWAYSSAKVSGTRKPHVLDKKAKIKLKHKSYTYTGKAIHPELTAFYGEEELKKGKDYTLSYENNVNAGTGSVIFKGKGEYSGTKTLTFKIKKAKWDYAPKDKTLKLSKKTLKLKPPKGAKVTVKIGSKKIARLSGTKTIKLKKAGTTKVKVTLAADKNHLKTVVYFKLKLYKEEVQPAAPLN